MLCEEQLDIGVPCNRPAVAWHVSPSTRWVHPRCKKHRYHTWDGPTLDENEFKVALIHDS